MDATPRACHVHREVAWRRPVSDRSGRAIAMAVGWRGAFSYMRSPSSLRPDRSKTEPTGTRRLLQLTPPDRAVHRVLRDADHPPPVPAPLITAAGSSIGRRRGPEGDLALPHRSAAAAAGPDGGPGARPTDHTPATPSLPAPCSPGTAQRPKLPRLAAQPDMKDDLVAPHDVDLPRRQYHWRFRRPR